MTNPQEKAQAYAKSRYYDSENVPADILAMDIKCGAEDWLAGYAQALADLVAEAEALVAPRYEHAKYIRIHELKKLSGEKP